jgi:hypothetical protein
MMTFEDIYKKCKLKENETFTLKAGRLATELNLDYDYILGKLNSLDINEAAEQICDENQLDSLECIIVDKILGLDVDEDWENEVRSYGQDVSDPDDRFDFYDKEKFKSRWG